MTKRQKRSIIRQLIAGRQRDILKAVDKMPDEWDGIELRAFIADKFNEEKAWTVMNDNKSERARAFKIACLIRGL